MAHELIGKKIKGIDVYGETYEAVVVALDFEKGITIDTLEPERMEDLDYCFDDNDHMHCLNRKEHVRRNSFESYKKKFKFVLEQIRSGVYDARKTTKADGKDPDDILASSLPPCAFS